MNVLVVMSDQHNPKAMGCAGDTIVKTPNMDALARRGTRFTAAYTNSPICVPARAAWATGRYVHDIEFWDNAMAYDGTPPGWGHALQASRVRVESIGKLHYQDADSPTGFDRQTAPMHIMGGIGQVWGSVRDPLPRKRGAKLFVAYSGGGESDYTRYDAASTQAACAWIDDARANVEPWVLYVGLVAPHHPYIAPQAFFDLYDPDAMPRAKLHPLDGHERHPWVAQYGEMLQGLDWENTDEERQRCTAAYYGLVSALDDNLGRIVDALDSSGQADDTVIVYTSDHGDTMGTRGLWGKSVMYEESAGIPLIVSGDSVPSGAVNETPVTLVDGAATILDAAAVEHDPSGPGQSWLEIARAGKALDRVAFSEYHAMGAPSAAFLCRRGQFKLHHYVGYEPELFDLEADPEETTNLADDPRHASTRASLERALTEIVDPEATDARARRAQAALVERFGGPERAAEMGTVGETPTPEA